jgi:hypothetical protein
MGSDVASGVWPGPERPLVGASGLAVAAAAARSSPRKKVPDV